MGVSEAFKKAILSDVRTTRIKLRIQTSDGTIYTMTDRDILQGSLYINSRCVSGDDIEIGALYASELGVSIKYSDNPYNFKDAVIEPRFELCLEDNSYEPLELGVFTVSEISRNGDFIKLICMDNLLKFDKKITLDELAFVGEKYRFYMKPIRAIIYCCEKCNVFTNLNADNFGDWANADYMAYAIDFEPDDLPTYRDLLMYSLQMIGCFGKINRYGLFDIGRFGGTVETILTPFNRFSLIASDYEVRNIGFEYSGILVGGAYYPINFDDNKYLNQYNWSAENTKNIAAILKRMYTDSDLENVSYVPCTIEYFGDPSLDVGESITVDPIIPSLGRLKFSDLANKNFSDLESYQFGLVSDVNLKPFNTIIMQHNWVYRGKSTIYSYGKSAMLRDIYIKKKGRLK